MHLPCRDDGPLPDNVELIGQNLTFLSGVKHQHAGLYECRFSYHHLNAALRFNVTVKPRPLQPGRRIYHRGGIFILKWFHCRTLMWNLLSFFSVPPTISVGLHREDGCWVIECVAAEAVPAASVSWLVSQSVSEEFWVNSTSYNGSRTVRGVFLVPVCSPWELTAKCVIHHPAFERPENRSVTLPLCGMDYKSLQFVDRFSAVQLLFSHHSSPKRHRQYQHGVERRSQVHQGVLLCDQCLLCC